MTGPGFHNVDFSLLKNTPITERMNLQFRSEFFNALNHPNFGLPGSTVDDFGGASITGTSTDNRQKRLYEKYLNRPKP